MIERIKSSLLLKDRVPVYEQRAYYYRQRAIIEAISRGILDFLGDKTEGVDLIDIKETVALDVPNQERKLEFAFDKDGLVFARIEDGKYYAIKSSLSQDLLDSANRNDNLAKSYWRRLANLPYERDESAWFGVTVVVSEVNDVLVEGTIRLYEQLQTQKELIKRLGNSD